MNEGDRGQTRGRDGQIRRHIGTGYNRRRWPQRNHLSAIAYRPHEHERRCRTDDLHAVLVLVPVEPLSLASLHPHLHYRIKLRSQGNRRLLTPARILDGFLYSEASKESLFFPAPYETVGSLLQNDDNADIFSLFLSLAVSSESIPL